VLGAVFVSGWLRHSVPPDIEFERKPEETTVTLPKLFLTALFTSLISLATPAFADSIKFIGATGPVVGGVYVAPYQLQDSAILGDTTINVICDAYANEVVPGETWNAQIETFNSNGTLNGTALFSTMTGSQTLYDDAVYLYSEFLNGKADAAGTNYAIWALFDSSVVGSAPYTSTDASTLLAGITQSELNNFNFSPYDIITPTDAGSTGTIPQEYIYQGGPTPTPEPSSLLLLSSGLISLGFMKHRVFNN
jgi:hypothetical protein